MEAYHMMHNPEMGWVLLALIVWQVFIKVTAYIDGDLIRKAEEAGVHWKPNYNARVFYRGALAALQSWAIYGTDWYYTGCFFLLQLVWYWIQFDIEVNWVRGVKTFYLGQTAFTDKVFYRLLPKGHDIKFKLAAQFIAFWLVLGAYLQ